MSCAFRHNVNKQKSRMPSSSPDKAEHCTSVLTPSQSILTTSDSVSYKVTYDSYAAHHNKHIMLLSSQLAHPQLTMPRLSFSSLIKPVPAFIPTRLIPGLPRRRRKCIAKQKAPHTSEGLKKPTEYNTYDPAVRRKDIDFITTLFVVEQLKCEG